MRRARSNLARARERPSSKDVVLEDLCFDAQQAVEKALKALLASLNRPVPKTHSIADLLTRVRDTGITLPPRIERAAGLTDYSVQARYPGPYEPVTDEEWKDAVALAGEVVRWTQDRIDGAPIR